MQVIENTSQEQTVRAGINEKAFFERMGHLFDGSFSVLGELMQNARRAGATRIDVTVDVDAAKLTIQDNGHGIGNFGALIRMCDSDWSEGVALEEKPFGMGLFSCFYAGEAVSFMSNGKQLSLTLDDIVNKRMLRVKVIDDAPSVGAIVRIDGLKEVLLKPDGRKRAAVIGEFEALSLGFPVPVFLNGQELPRSHAADQMAFAVSDIGLVSIYGIQRGNDLSDRLVDPVCYLQGLPIGSVRWDGRRVEHDNRSIVHLDSVRFIAKMPDRKQLFDSTTQNAIIVESLKASIRHYLVEQKVSLSPEEMVRRYWSACHHFGVGYLFNDIAFLPAIEFRQIDNVEASSDHVSVCRVDSRIGDSDLISRQSILNGDIVVWRNAYTDTLDEPWAVACLKVMKHASIYSLARELNDGHWINAMTPSIDDLVFNVSVVGGSEDCETYYWNQSTTIRLCDAIQVDVISEVDSDFKRTFLLEKDWIFCPVIKDEKYTEDYVAWVCRDNRSNDRPALALCTFCDEWGVFLESDADAGNAGWDQLVNNLLRCNLAAVVTNAFPHYDVTFAEHHLSQFAVCVVQTRDYGNGATSLKLKVHGVEEGQFDALAAAIGGVSAEQIKQAFDTVFGPGKPFVLPAA